MHLMFGTIIFAGGKLLDDLENCEIPGGFFLLERLF